MAFVPGFCMDTETRIVYRKIHPYDGETDVVMETFNHLSGRWSYEYKRKRTGNTYTLFKASGSSPNKLNTEQVEIFAEMMRSKALADKR